jgi:predicted acyl esterase
MMSDGTMLACSRTSPGVPSAAGRPGVVLFHGLGATRRDMESIAEQFLAPAGFETLQCDARGNGSSGGMFGLDGARDVQDARELFDWFAGQLGSTNIGALGVSLGGGAVWNALAAGVPFRAAVAAATWTNLLTALAPQNLSKSGLAQYLASLVPANRWDPQLLAGAAGLIAGSDLGPAAALSAARSAGPKLSTITTPTLLLQGRHDFLFDIDQALAAYKALRGPKRLYVGDLGHSPAKNPPAELPTYLAEATKWFDRFLNGRANGIDKAQLELAHDPWDGKTTSYTSLPPTHTVSVTLPGSSTMSGATGKVVRSVRVTGGPHETFGDSNVVVRYSGAQGWDRLVAVLAVAGSPTPITAGGVKLTGASGKVTIRLMNEAVRFAAGKKLVLYLSSASVAQDPGDTLYVTPVSPQARITIGRVTLNISVLKRAVSKALH